MYTKAVSGLPDTAFVFTDGILLHKCHKFNIINNNCGHTYICGDLKVYRGCVAENLYQTGGVLCVIQLKANHCR